MEQLSIGDVQANPFGSDIDRRGLSDPLGTTDTVGGSISQGQLFESASIQRISRRAAIRSLRTSVRRYDIALNRYRLDPGEQFSGGMRAHMDQEEVFVIVEGEATVETMDGEVTVGEAAVIRFEPGEFQSGKNDSDGEVVAFARGAPVTVRTDGSHRTV